MTDFKLFSNTELILDTKRSVAEEKKATLAVIERLREIRRRRLHVEMGYPSLHQFCVVELKYSDGEAFRRIHAMELCEELPKAEQAISEGTLSLTNAASLQVYLEKQEAKYPSVRAKEELLSLVAGKSTRECEKIFYPEQTGAVLRFIPDAETMEDLTRLAELMAIAPSDTAALIKKIAKIARKAVDPTLKKDRKTKSASAQKLAAISAPKFKRPYTSIAIKKAVWVRDGSQCAYYDPATKRRCWSKFGLQLDHIVPVSYGGLSTLENLRLLCFAHHHFITERVFGKEKIESYYKVL